MSARADASLSIDICLPHGHISTLLLHLLHCSFQPSVTHIAPGSGNVADNVYLDAFLAHQWHRARQSWLELG